MNNPENKTAVADNAVIETIAEMAKPLAVIAILARGSNCDMALFRKEFHKMIDQLFADLPREEV